jgi:flagellar biosynthesis/type III secretory pathway protein FliH
VALEIIREALQLAASSVGVSIRLNPSDFQNLGSQVERLAESLCRLGPAKIVSDSSITAGGCLVDTQFGVIDQQIESQLKRIEQELL